MRQTQLRVTLLLALIIIPTSRLSSLDIGVSFDIGNIGFTPERAMSDTSLIGGDFFWGGTISIDQIVSESFEVHVAIQRDLILGNSVDALLQYTTDYFSLGLGSHMGILNSLNALVKPGLASSLRLEIPGFAFILLRTGNTLGETLRDIGDYSQGYSQLSVGFQVLNAICTLGMDSSQLVMVRDVGTVADGLTRYYLAIEIFEKNVPIRLDISFAYQSLSKTYLQSPANTVDAFNSIIVDAGLHFLFTNDFAVFLDGSGSIYTWGAGQLTGTSVLGFGTLLFNANVGFTLSFDTSPPAQENIP